MTRLSGLFVGLVLIVIVLLSCLLPDTLTAETAVHTFDCKNCHIPSLSVEQLGGGNVCLSCHDDTLNMALGDSSTGSTNTAFNLLDASNAHGNNPGALAGSGQTSHNWSAPDIQPRAGAVAPSRTLHPQFYSRFGSSQGKVTCSRCHNPHADRTNPQLLITGAGTAQQMCLACHVTWNQGSGVTNVTHPVGIDYAAAATAHPGKYASAPPEDDGNLGTNGPISLFNGKLLCGTCHQVHFADSNAPTADTPENFAALSSNGGDGKLLRADGASRTNKSGLCQTCHVYQEHGKSTGEKAGCLVCHSGHSYDPVAPNYYMLRKSATTTTYNTVSGLDYSSPGVLDPANKYRYWNDRTNGTANGFCEKCHGDAVTIGTGAGSYHVASAVCTDCHEHSGALGTFSGSCGACHGNGATQAGWPDGIANNLYPAYSWADDAGSHARHAATLGGNASCGFCHPMPGSGNNHTNGTVQVLATWFAYTGATQTCSNISCHANTGARWGTSGCLGCHNVAQGTRAAVGGMFATNSHHIQGVQISDTHCYACHWEANSDGTIASAYHGGTETPGASIDLVIYGAGSRPASYAAGTTALQYTADGSRDEITELNSHCLGCHSDQNNAATPFGDGKTPKQYAWDGTSVASRYSQADTTTFGKYVTVPNAAQKSQTKAYSAHGNATLNQGGWSASTGVDGVLPNTRNGTVNVACYDCHNSHGSNVVGKTTSYVSTTVNGGLLKDTQASRGGYSVTYKPVAGGTSNDKSQRNPGASLCMDCHYVASGGSTQPWGYQDTYGASGKIIGYYDSPYFAPGPAGVTDRYPFMAATNSKGGHFEASSPLGTPAMGSIDGLCTPCHDPHGVSPSLGTNRQYGVPLLKGTWLTSPYKQDVPPVYNYSGRATSGDRYLYIDGTTFGGHIAQLVQGIGETDAQFGGLCLRCHPKPSLTDGVTHTWKSKDRVHESVKGWDTSGETKHYFSCSKCHAPHLGSILPRLMVTDCMDAAHKGRVANQPYLSTSGSSDCGSGRIPGSYTDCGGDWNPQDYSITCHEAQNGYANGSTDQSWNLVTPWAPTFYFNPQPRVESPAKSVSFPGKVQFNIAWGTSLASNSVVDYGVTSSYGQTASNASLVTNHAIPLDGLVNHNTYHFRARSTTSLGEQVASVNQSYYISLPPTLGALIAEPSQLCAESSCSVNLAWNAAQDVDGGPVEYYVEVDDSSSFVSPDANSGWASTTNATVGPLASNKTWYWRLRARDANHVEAVSAWSGTGSFSLVPNPAAGPVVPTLSDEPNFTCGGNCSVNLVWSAVANPYPALYGAVQYYLEVDDDPAFASPNGNSGWVVATNATIGSLDSEKTWHFRVRTRYVNYPDAVSAWSAAKQFSILYSPPSTPTGLSAPNTVCPGGCSAALSWSPSTGYGGGDVEYSVAVDDDAAFASIDASSGWVSGASWSTGTLGTNKTWYWRVQARDASHVTALSAWSSTASFYILENDPVAGVPVLTDEPDLSCSGSCSVNLAWSPGTNNPVYGAVEYYLEVDNDPAFASPDANSGWVTITNATVGPLATDTTWYFRTRSRYAAYPGAPSAWANAKLFHTVTPPVGSKNITFTWTSVPGNSISIDGTLYGGTGSVVKTVTTSFKAEVVGAPGQVGGGAPDDYWCYYAVPAPGGSPGAMAAEFIPVNGDSFTVQVGSTPGYQAAGGGGGSASYVARDNGIVMYAAGAGGGGGGEATYDSCDFYGNCNYTCPEDGQNGADGGGFGSASGGSGGGGAIYMSSDNGQPGGAGGTGSVGVSPTTITGDISSPRVTITLY